MASWAAWQRISDGKTLSGPGAHGAVVVSIRGTDNAVYTNRFNSGTSWAGWTPVPGVATDATPGFGNFGGAPSIFVRGFVSRIYYSQSQGSAWSNWMEVPGGGLTPSAPAVADNVVMVRGTDDGIHYNALGGSGWIGWHRVSGNGLTPSAPAITRFGAGYFAVVRGTDNLIYHQSLGSDFSTSGAWRPVPGGGQTPSGPAVVGSMVVVRGTDNGLHYNSFDGLNTRVRCKIAFCPGSSGEAEGDQGSAAVAGGVT